LIDFGKTALLISRLFRQEKVPIYQDQKKNIVEENMSGLNAFFYADLLRKRIRPFFSRFRNGFSGVLKGKKKSCRNNIKERFLITPFASSL
jgi:hypothetical protein